jgi:uncharacterized protein (DUF362 family)
MKRISRRQALKYWVTGAAAIAAAPLLNACQDVPVPPLTQEPTESEPPNDPASPSSQMPATATEPPSAQTTRDDPAARSSPTAIPYPDLVVARKAEPETLVREALAALGGMERFVPPGGWVIIKPNICTAYHTYEYAATTNPWVIGTLVALCFEAGAGKVQVMDYPFGGSAKDAYRISGIAEQVENNGGEMVQMASFKFREVKIENSLSLKRVEIFEDVFQADTLINVPIAKNHGLTTLSLGMKNLMGLITDRGNIHADFGLKLTDLARTIKPTLTVVDAVRILLRNGPTGGNLADVQQMDTVIASQDIVAADGYAATLFGFQPDDIEYVRAGGKAGLGQSDLSKLNIRELILA